jgi:hypothetical protein
MMLSMGRVYNSIVRSAAVFGHLKVVQYGFERWPCDEMFETTLTCALFRNHWHILKYVLTLNKSLFREIDWIDVARKGNEDFLRFGIENEIVMTNNVWKEAAMNGHLNCLKLAFEKKIVISDDVWIAAAEMNNFSDIFPLVCAIENDHILSKEVLMTVFRKSGFHDDLLKTARSYGITLSQNILEEIDETWSLESLFK